MIANTIDEGGYTLTILDNVEYVNPIVHDFESLRAAFMPMLKKIIKQDKVSSGLSEQVITASCENEILKIWEDAFKKILSIKFPIDFFNFLTCMKKKKQEAILKNHIFSTNVLQAMAYKAFCEYNFTFSFYRFERQPKNFENKHLPKIVHLNEDGTIDKVGETDCSDNELKALIKQRNVVLAKFLDKGKVWHCFLYTYDSMNGKEFGNTPHIHYISSAFGHNITRDYVLSELKKGKYELPSMLHLNYDSERNEKATSSNP